MLDFDTTYPSPHLPPSHGDDRQTLSFVPALRLAVVERLASRVASLSGHIVGREPLGVTGGAGLCGQGRGGAGRAGLAGAGLAEAGRAGSGGLGPGWGP